MKKLIFILLAVGLPLGVATLANPAGLSSGGLAGDDRLGLGRFCHPVAGVYTRPAFSD
jgi:hypothetical protein